MSHGRNSQRKGESAVRPLFKAQKNPRVDFEQTKKKPKDKEKPSKNGQVEKKPYTLRSFTKCELQEPEFRGKPPKQGDLFDELELEQLDRLPPMGRKPSKDDKCEGDN